MSTVRAVIRSVNVDGCALKGELITERVTAAVTMQAMKDTEPFVPFLTGALNRSARTETDRTRGFLIWGGADIGKYASRQYFNYPNKNLLVHPGAQWHWFDQSKATNLQKWISVARAQARKDSSNG